MNCNTCPFRRPQDTETWREVALQQRQFNPHISPRMNAKITAIERLINENINKNVSDCEGYSFSKALLGRSLGKVVLALRAKKSLEPLTKRIPWQERVCNNPYLETTAYQERRAQLAACAGIYVVP